MSISRRWASVGTTEEYLSPVQVVWSTVQQIRQGAGESPNKRLRLCSSGFLVRVPSRLQLSAIEIPVQNL